MLVEMGAVGYQIAEIARDRNAIARDRKAKPKAFTATGAKIATGP
jgi:hypothetical protein